VAILAGDLQQSWAFALLADLRKRGVPADLVSELVERMATWLTPQLLEGEMLDVQYALTPFDALTEDDVLTMLSKKTAALLEYAAWSGAKIGLAGKDSDDDLPARLAKFASLCGTAFQLHDDLLGLTADEAVLGKPVGSDLREGKRTLIVYRALARTDEAGKKRILATLGNGAATPAEIDQTLQIIRESGAIDDISDLANSHISQATDLLNTLPDTPQRALLSSWAKFLLARRH
jgi:geranylgeranyl diphosphate synthase type I